jgi:NADH:ubiquinone oxidoreductase subunit 2 (subunit N)
MADYILLNFNLKVILAFLPELVFLNLALIFVTIRVFAPAFGVTWFDGSERLAQSDLRFTRIARYMVAGLLFFYVSCGALCLIEDHSDRWALLSDQFMFDWPLLLIKVAILAAFYAVLAASEAYVFLPAGRKFGYEFLLISLVAVTGSLLLASSFDFLSLYLALEMQALAFYVLAGYKTNSEFSAEAAIKYFIIGAFGSILLLLGVSFIYGATGVTNFFQLGCFLAAAYSEFYSNTSLLLGLFLFLAAVLLKLGLAPLHFWLPDAYQGAPLPVTLLFSTVPKISFFFVLVRALVVPGSCLIERWNHVTGSFDFMAVGFFSR